MRQPARRAHFSHGGSDEESHDHAAHGPPAGVVGVTAIHEEVRERLREHHGVRLEA